jgi:hypothetical protein
MKTSPTTPESAAVTVPDRANTDEPETTTAPDSGDGPILGGDGTPVPTPRNPPRR